MNTVRILGQAALTSIVMLGSAIVTLDIADAQAQSCTQVQGPKRARILSKNCSPDANVPSGREVQPSPIVKKQELNDPNQLTPRQSVNNADGIGGTVEEQTQPKVLLRGPKRGGYIDN